MYARGVYCRSCRAYHNVELVQGREMTRCNGMWWFVDRHPVTANRIPITGATKRTRRVTPRAKEKA